MRKIAIYGDVNLQDLVNQVNQSLENKNIIHSLQFAVEGDIGNGGTTKRFMKYVFVDYSTTELQDCEKK